MSSVNVLETPSTSPGYNAVSGVGGQTTLNCGAGVAGGSKTVNTTFRDRNVNETPKRPTGLLSLKNAPKKRKN